MTRDEFRVLFCYLESAFPASKIGAHTADVYWEEFRLVPGQFMERAVHSAARTLEWFPVVARLRELLAGDSDYRRLLDAERAEWNAQQLLELRAANGCRPPIEGPDRDLAELELGGVLGLPEGTTIEAAE